MKNNELNNCEDHIEKSLRSTVTTKDAGIILSIDASDFGIINDKVPDALLEIRYYSTCNLVGESIDGYLEKPEKQGKGSGDRRYEGEVSATLSSEQDGNSKK